MTTKAKTKTLSKQDKRAELYKQQDLRTIRDLGTAIREIAAQWQVNFTRKIKHKQVIYVLQVGTKDRVEEVVTSYNSMIEIEYRVSSGLVIHYMSAGVSQVLSVRESVQLAVPVLHLVRVQSIMARLENKFDKLISIHKNDRNLLALRFKQEDAAARKSKVKA